MYPLYKMKFHRCKLSILTLILGIYMITYMKVLLRVKTKKGPSLCLLGCCGNIVENKQWHSNISWSFCKLIYNLSLQLLHLLNKEFPKFFCWLNYLLSAMLLILQSCILASFRPFPPGYPFLPKAITIFNLANQARDGLLTRTQLPSP